MDIISINIQHSTFQSLIKITQVHKKRGLYFRLDPCIPMLSDMLNTNLKSVWRQHFHLR